MDLQKQIILQAPRWRRKGWVIMEKYYYAHFCRLGANAVSANNTRVFLVIIMLSPRKQLETNG